MTKYNDAVEIIDIQTNKQKRKKTAIKELP